MKIQHLLGIFAAVLLSSATLPAFAGGAPVCKADKEKFCKDVPKGELRECIQKNQNQFSPECKSFLEKKREQHQAVKEACKADREKFCGTFGNDKADKGKVRECMKSHENQLSATCREKIDSLKKWKSQRHSAWDTLRLPLTA